MNTLLVTTIPRCLLQPCVKPFLFFYSNPLPLPFLSFLAHLAFYFKEKMNLIEDDFLMLPAISPSVPVLPHLAFPSVTMVARTLDMAENSPSSPHQISPPLFQSRYRRFPFSFIHFIHLFLLCYWVLPISIQPCHKFSHLKNGLLLTSAAFRFCHFLLLEIIVSYWPQNSFQWFLTSGKNPKCVQRPMGCFKIFLLSLSRVQPPQF